jgi:hypothetical protein
LSKDCQIDRARTARELAVELGASVNINNQLSGSDRSRENEKKKMPANMSENQMKGEK